MKKIFAVVLLLVLVLPLVPIPALADASAGSDTSLGGTYYGEINNEFTLGDAPWDWSMSATPYRVRVKEDFTSGQILEFETQGEAVYLQPMALEWTNDLAQIQSISMPQAVTPTITNPSNQGTITWDNAYGSGIDFEWQCTPVRLNKILTIGSLADLPTPQQYIQDGGNPVLRLNLIFAPPSGVDIYVDGSLWDKSTKRQTFDAIEFRKGSETLWYFEPLMYWDSVGNEGQSVATLEKSGSSLYISIRVPYSWLQSAVFPVFIDADVAIDTGGGSNMDHYAVRGGPFWTSATDAYVIYIDASLDLKYRKTVDGGDNWDAAVNVRTGSVKGFDCWADWQTVGDDGTKIHIVYLDQGTNDVRYVYLDISTDTVGGDDLIEACQGTGTMFNGGSTRRQYTVSITKTRGGNLAVALQYQDSVLTVLPGFYTSPDADTWTSKNDPYEGGTEYDWIMLFPGNEADDQDVWGTYRDDSTGEISLKTFDDSGDNWGEQAITNGGTSHSLTYYKMMGGAIRFSDGHLIFAVWNDYDVVTADLEVWDINGAASITQKTNVITDEAESALASVFIDQVLDDVYVSYASGTAWGSAVKVFYKKSTDGGANWGAETAMQADAEDNEGWISVGCAKAAVGWYGKFQPIWLNVDLHDLFTNTDNGIIITTPPTVTTNAATYITDQSARLNAYVVNDEGDTLDLRFQYDDDADVSDGNSTAWDAGFNTGESHHEVVGDLLSGTQYWFRVQARVGATIWSSATLSFTTAVAPAPPTDAYAYTEDDKIVVVWVRGLATEGTMVRWKLGDYPTSITDGTLLTNTIFGSATHEDLDYGTAYYYALWGYVGSNYTAPIYARITTSAGTDATAPPTTATPTFWLTTVDYTRYANMPLYSFINDFVNSLSANLNFGWTILGLIVSALAGVFVFFKSRDGKAAVMTIGGVMVALVLLRLLPGFMAVFAVLFFIGASKMSKIGQGGYAQ